MIDSRAFLPIACDLSDTGNPGTGQFNSRNGGTEMSGTNCKLKLTDCEVFDGHY